MKTADSLGSAPRSVLAVTTVYDLHVYLCTWLSRHSTCYTAIAWSIAPVDIPVTYLETD